MNRVLNFIIDLKGIRLVLAAFLAGGLSALAMAPFFLWPILFATYTVAVCVLDAVCLKQRAGLTSTHRLWDRLRHAALCGWAFGFGYFVAGIYWIGYAFLANGGPWLTVSMPFGVAGLAAGLALFYALAFAIAALLWRPGYARILGFAFACFTAEAARSNILTGFPWNLPGQALAATDAQMQAAAYIGTIGLTLLAFLVFTSPAAFFSHPEARGRRRFMPFASSIGVVAAIYIAGLCRLQSHPHPDDAAGVRVRIVQPNIPQTEKYKPENADAFFSRTVELSRSGTDGTGIAAFTHVLWPETAVPFLFMLNGKIFRDSARLELSRLIPPGTSLIVGGERAEGEVANTGRIAIESVFNSVFVLGAEAKVDAVYDKVHLVPFGEYMPLSSLMKYTGLEALSHRASGFQAGNAPGTVIAGKGPPFSPVICYEIIFPGAVSSQTRPEWIVNITNDAWFGRSTGPYQHLHLVRLHAVEEGLPVMRAANTGISAVIDPYGRILAMLDLGTIGTIDSTLPLPLPETFYKKNHLTQFIVLFIFPLQLYLIMVLLERNERFYR